MLYKRRRKKESQQLCTNTENINFNDLRVQLDRLRNEKQLDCKTDDVYLPLDNNKE